MKNLFDRPVKVILFLLFVSISSVACKGGETPEPGALDRDTSYAFGMFLAGQVGMEDLSFDYTAFMEGFRDFNEARETRLSQDQMMEKIQAVVLQMQARQNEEMASVGETNRAEGEAYLAENGAKSGITTTASGLQYEVITQGRGNKPVTTDTVRVQYEGTLIDGTVFDSSYARGTPAEFKVNQVIPGWVEGLQLMSEGSTYRFFIPGGLAYGMNPPPGSPIQPNSTLIFKVELLSIVR